MFKATLSSSWGERQETNTSMQLGSEYKKKKNKLKYGEPPASTSGTSKISADTGQRLSQQSCKFSKMLVKEEVIKITLAMPLSEGPTEDISDVPAGWDAKHQSQEQKTVDTKYLRSNHCSDMQ